jgi:hypothetical protein
MNQDTITQTQTSNQHASVSRARLWTGTILTILVILFLAFDAITKIIRLAPVMEACQKLGIGPNLVVGIGILLLACTVIYAIPKTAILGAILLTGYLGGATLLHVLTKGGIFPTVFAIGFGVLVWAGLALREPRLARWIFLRQ